MPYFVYGVSRDSGEVLPRVFSEASSREEATRHGELRGMVVRAVVPCRESDRPLAHRPSLPPRAPSAAEAAELVVRREASDFRESLERATPTTPVTYAIFALNIAIYAAMVLGGVDPMKPRLIDLIGWGGDYGPLTVDGQWWRLVSATFVHAGLMHLFYNMLALAYVGQTVERLLGNAMFALVYLVSGIGGGLLALCWNPMIVHVGASGAIFGVYGVLGALVLTGRGALPPHVAAATGRFVAVFVGINLLYSLQPGVSLAAHCGGFVTGFLCGLAAGRTASGDGSDPRRALAVGGVAAALLAIGLGTMQLRYPQLPALARVLERFDAIDLSLPDTSLASRLQEQLHAGSRLELAERLEQDILPRWREARAAVEAYEPVPAALSGQVASIADYQRLREDGFEQLAAALRSRDREALEAAQNQLDHASGVWRRAARAAPRVRYLSAPPPPAPALAASAGTRR